LYGSGLVLRLGIHLGDGIAGMASSSLVVW
jgi:hypothetical protein